MFIDDTHLFSFIADSHLISRDDLERAHTHAVETKKQLGDVLVSQGKLSSENMARIYAQVLGVPFVSFLDTHVPFEVFSLIPEPISRRHNIVAVEHEENTLHVAVLHTSDISVLEQISHLKGFTLRPRFTDTDSIKNLLVQYQKHLKSRFGDQLQKESQSLAETSDEAVKIVSCLRIVSILVKHALIERASTIHIEAVDGQVLVRYRIGGVLHDAMLFSPDMMKWILYGVTSLTTQPFSSDTLPYDERFTLDLDGCATTVCVSIVSTVYGPHIVLHIIQDTALGFTLEQLNYYGSAREAIYTVLHETKGLILVAGPTGSGKTTTLYTLLDMLNRPDVSIGSIEDPIESYIPRITQIQVDSTAGFSFVRGLKTLIQHDADVIMVGELRDQETASLAVNTVRTHRLVLSAVHASSAVSALQRLVEMCGDAQSVVSSVSLIIGHAVVRRLISPRISYTLDTHERAHLEKRANMKRVLEVLKENNIVSADATWETILFFKGTSEDFAGYVGVHEVLVPSRTIKELVREGASVKTIETQARKEGMLTLFEDGIVACVRGLTTLDEVMRTIL